MLASKPETDSKTERSELKLNFDLEEFVYKYRFTLTVLLLGLILIGFGIIYFKNASTNPEPKIEVLDAASDSSSTEIVVEVSGEVEKPGVYKLPIGSRVEDVLIAGGGISVNADRAWVEKYINRAAKLIDGQKIFIPGSNEQSDVLSAKSNGGVNTGLVSQGSGIGGLVNINLVSQKELEALPGIGPVYAQSIIEHRPYSSVEELLSKGALKKNVYEKIKDKITTY